MGSKHNYANFFTLLHQIMTFGNIAQFLWWLWLFMLWIIFFDESSRKVVSGWIKKAIKKATNNIFKSLWIWFFATILFQGSSAVLLILESFVSAGMIEFSHAAKIILWCNMGSSAVWIILETLWLEFDLMTIALPALWISVLLYFLLKSDKIKNVLKIIIWLCLIFLWLDYMNTWMSVVAQYADFAAWANHSIFLFFIIWLVWTLIVQSSSITIVLTLSAANAGIIDYRMWIMLLLWAFIWTTGTAVLWCLEWWHLKKQVAATQVIFNIMVATLWIISLPWIVRLLNKLPVSKLVWLEIFVIGWKVLCVAIMLPFINKYTAWIKKLFPKRDFDFGLHTKNTSPKILDAAFPALHDDITLITKRVLKHCLNTRHLDEMKLIENDFNLELLDKCSTMYSNDELRAQYDEIKEIEQLLLVFITKIRQNIDNKFDLDRLDQYQESLSCIVYATKYMKDVHKTIWRRKDSDNKYLINAYVEFKKILIQLYHDVLRILDGWYNESIVRKMDKLVKEIKDVVDKKALNPLIDNLKESKNDSTIISDTLYMDHYFHISCKNIVLAIANLYGKEFLAKDADVAENLG